MGTSYQPPRRSSMAPEDAGQRRPSTPPSTPPPPLGSGTRPAAPSVRPSSLPHANGTASKRPSIRPSFGIFDEPMVHEGTPGAFFGSWKNVFVSVWRAQGTVEGIDRMLAAIAAMPRIAEKRSDIYIIAEGARLPEARVRDHFIDVIKASSEELAAVAVVVGGTGFWASAIRSFVTGLHWVAPRSSFDFKLHGSIEDVVE